jgi:transcriptional regulator with XRE-family HTH domain
MLTRKEVPIHMVRMDDRELYKRFGALVRDHRQRRKMKQAEVGAAIGLSRASIASIETGRQQIPIHYLYRLANAFDVEAYALLPIVDETEPGEQINREIKSSLMLSEREQASVAKALGAIQSKKGRSAK